MLLTCTFAIACIVFLYQTRILGSRTQHLQSFTLQLHAMRANLPNSSEADMTSPHPFIEYLRSETKRLGQMPGQSVRRVISQLRRTQEHLRALIRLEQSYGLRSTVVLTGLALTTSAWNAFTPPSTSSNAVWIASTLASVIVVLMTLRFLHGFCESHWFWDGDLTSSGKAWAAAQFGIQPAEAMDVDVSIIYRSIREQSLLKGVEHTSSMEEALDDISSSLNFDEQCRIDRLESFYPVIELTTLATICAIQLVPFVWMLKG